MTQYYKIYTAKAPINIAVIKYWGKSDEELKLPINDSISGTLDLTHLCAKTTVAISSSFDQDEFLLNGKRQDLSDGSNAGLMLAEMRKMSALNLDITKLKVHIVSENNFPTAAGLASSAAGYACLAFVLGNVFGITDKSELSKMARRGSGSACRSLFGGFVQWHKGRDHGSSLAEQIVDHNHWPEMRVIIGVVNDAQKDVSSSEGMRRSVQTSSLIRYRKDYLIPERTVQMKTAIIQKDFEKFASLTMLDSNQFHAICLDSSPPIFYLNDTSRLIIKICTKINHIYGRNMVAYTFDAGPNVCIYCLEDFAETIIQVLKTFFGKGKEVDVRGLVCNNNTREDADKLCNTLKCNDTFDENHTINYIIHTKIGQGPTLVPDHISADDLNMQ